MPRKPRSGAHGIDPEAIMFFMWNGTLPTRWSMARTEQEIRLFWEDHREVLLELFLERNRQRKGEPGARPRMYWDELEEQGHRRRRTGTHVWCGPVRGDGGNRSTLREPRFESDLRFLKRLGLPLAPWEEVPKKRGDP